MPTDSLDQVVYTLTVAYPPRVTVSPTEEIVVKEGEGTKISCTSDAKPAGDFAWTKNGAKIDGGNTSELSLDQVRILHFGQRSSHSMGSLLDYPVRFVYLKTDIRRWKSETC